MTQAPARGLQDPHKFPQAARGVALRRAPGQVPSSGAGRPATRGSGEVIELGHGTTVYPARDERGRWRAVCHEAGRREQCEAATEEKLAAKLEKVRARLKADAPNMKRPGADLIAHYLDPDRLPVSARWSRKHAHTQRRLCERSAAPVIASVACQDIKAEHTLAIVNAAPTAGEGDRVRGHDLRAGQCRRGRWLPGQPAVCEGALAGRDRPLPAPAVSVAGESVLWVEPGEIPSDDDIAKLGQALAGRHGDRDEPMASTAAYSGLRWGELPPSRSLRSARTPESSPSTARSSKSPVTFTLRLRRTASTAGRSTPSYPRQLPACRQARSSGRRGPRRAGGRDQPARPALPVCERQVLAVVQLQPWPAVALVGSYELLAWMIRTAAAGGPDRAPSPDHGVPQADQPGAIGQLAVSLIREAVTAAEPGDGASPELGSTNGRLHAACVVAQVRGPGPGCTDQADRGTTGADRAGKVPDHVGRAGCRPAVRLSARRRPVTSMPPPLRPTAPASGRASRCRSASWQRHSAGLRRWARSRMAETRQGLVAV